MGRPMVPEDLYRIRNVTDVVTEPGGARVVFVVSWLDEETDSNRSQLHEWTETGSRALTHGHADTSPRFSPDARLLSFVAGEHEQPSELRVLPLEGGEPWVLGEFPDGVSEHVWLPDSTGLVVAAPTRPPDQVGLDADELARRPRRLSSIQYRYNGRGWIHDRHQHLFHVPLEGEQEQLTDGPWDDSGPGASADGETIYFTSARSDNREWESVTDIWAVPITGGQPRRITDGRGRWFAVRAHPSGDRLVGIGSTDAAEVALQVPHLIELADGSARGIGDGETMAVSLIGGGSPQVEIPDPDHVVVSGNRRGAVHVDSYDLGSGSRRSLVDGDRVVGRFAIAGDAVYFTATSATRPSELYVCRDGEEHRLTDLNDAFLDGVNLIEPEQVEVVADDGYPVHAWVLSPSTDGPHPALVYVHGGPLAQYSHGFFDEFQLAASAGFVVIGANPRGSDGYGSDHAHAIVGDLGNRDWADIRAVTDHLAARPDVDAARIGIGGGSYGGFLTGWAIGHTDRYRAALSERAVNNWETMQGTSDIGGDFVKLYCGATTISDVDALRRQSPITYASRMRTPTLIIHSEEDWRCPPEQAEQLFVALRMQGVATEFVRFPGQNHELTRAGRPSHRVERFHIVHDWFQRWLG